MSYPELNLKPKKKPQKRSCLQTTSYFFLFIFMCGIVSVGILIILGPVIGNMLTEVTYVQPDYSLNIQGIDVTYQAPQFPASGGVFENGLYFQVDSHTVNIAIEDGIAQVNHNLVVTNAGSNMIEGVFIIPLPSEQSPDTLSVEIDNQTTSITSYDSDAGRTRIQSLAQTYNDPSLYAYANQAFIEIPVFPLTGTKTITLNYTHETGTLNGLNVLDIPLAFPVSTERPIRQFDITVTAIDDVPFRNIYPATLDLSITQDNANSFTGTSSQSGFVPPKNLALYYANSDSDISLNLITFNDNSDDDGYFVLMAEPSSTLAEQVVAQDVILVLDQSGSMSCVKWQQAQEASRYVLEHLNPNDRFFVTTFSSSHAFFNNALSPESTASDAIAWLNNRGAEGGTNINDALLETLAYTDTERPTTLLFMTDGQATEGEVDTENIVNNLRAAVSENIRIFVFGVGDGVNTTLLDTIAREFRGETAYVRQNETIDAEIATLFAKISSPILTDIQIDFGDAVAGDFVPSGQLPDLYAGESMILVGRYRRGGDNLTITLTGTSNNETETYTFDNMLFETEQGGNPFVAQLWAARRLGDILNTVRLSGDESPELVNSITTLSLRYGIMTPQTQFMLEQEGILTSTGQAEANNQMMLNVSNLQQNQTGAYAIDTADALNSLASSRSYAATPNYIGSISSSSYFRRQIVEITPTPLPTIGMNGVLITITAQEPSSNTSIPDEGIQYVMSLNDEAFNRALFTLQGNAIAESSQELPVIVGELINAYGLEQGIEIYNDTFGAFLPLIPLEDALIDGNYVIAPEADSRQPSLRSIYEKTFILQSGVYTDTRFVPDTMIPETIIIGSDAYNTMINNQPDILPYLSAGIPQIITWDNAVYSFDYE